MSRADKLWPMRWKQPVEIFSVAPGDIQLVLLHPITNLISYYSQVHLTTV